MGPGKLWLTHGPGSPGSIARAMANAYVRIRSANHEMSKRDLLCMTLMSRYGELNPKSTLGEEMLQMLFQAIQAGESLSELTIQVWHRENPMALRAQIDPLGQSAYSQAVQIIKEETAKIAGDR